MFYQLKNLLFSSLVKTKFSVLNIGETCRRLHLAQPGFSKMQEIRTVRTSRRRDEGTEGERNLAIDSLNIGREEMFPDEHLPDRLFNNVPFSQVPICNISVSKNNTIISLTDAKGVVRFYRSCGVEGFKNTRKGTNIAAQATAITLGTNAISKGFNMVRVRVRGLGPGRMSAIKGLEMAGLNIISVSDNTPVSWNPPRPRKQRRL